MTDLSPEAKELLRQARMAFSPPDGRIEAVRSAIQAQMAAFPGATPSISSPASGVATRALAAAGWGPGQIVASALVIGALGAGGLTAWLLSDRSSPAPLASIEAPARAQPASAAAPAEPAEEGIPPSATPPSLDPTPAWQASPADLPPSSKLLSLPRDRARGSNRKTPLEPTPARVPDSLAEEVRLLRDARSALDRGEPAQALRVLNDHEKRFQRGTLYEERLATRVQALCALGFVDGARSTAQELERVAPRSPHLARVRASCIAPPVK